MSDNKLTRQQIYDRIRETSKEEFVLEEMKRLGFWGKKGGEPTVPELLIKKETQLQQELNTLWEEKRKYQNKEAALKEMRMKRMAEAKQKRVENKKKKEQQRFEKAQAWQQKKKTAIIYLGEKVSVGLNKNDNDLSLLQKNSLPVFNNEAELVTAMGIEMKELQFLAFNRTVSTVSHYKKFLIDKKSGGKRLISAPMPRLKKAQYWILENILNKVTLHQAVNGFVVNRSIVTNALPHIGKDLVVNIDVKDFFPSIQHKRVKGLLQKLGYGEKIATILSLICTEAVTEQVAVDGKNYFVQKGQRILPQGAPTSPAITNILCYKLDHRLQGLANKLHCSYTRYADDITFSGRGDLNAQQIVWRIKKILQDEGFTVHPDKIRIMRRGTQQEVTGIVVNNQLSVNRKKLRQFRSLLHHLQNKPGHPIQWGNTNTANSLLGYANFIKMVNPVKAVRFQTVIGDLIQNNLLVLPASACIPPKTSLDKPAKQSDASKKEDDDKPWWSVV